MIREYQDKDYRELESWWISRGVTGASEDMLPSGLVYEKEGKPIAMVFLYVTDSRVAFVEWLTTRPNLSIAEAREAGDALESALEVLAKDKGCIYILGWVREGMMVKEAIRNGYALGDSQVTHIFKEIT